MMHGEFHWSSVERVIFGRPAADALAECVEQIGARRVFIVAGSHLQNETDHVASVERRLGSRAIKTWTGVRPHAPRSDVLALSRAISVADADLIVTMGGGSVTDAGKIAALVLKHDVQSVGDFGRLRVVAHPDGRVVTPRLDPPDIPVICIPATLSGGEFNSLSGATDEETEHKQGYDQRDMAPQFVILDPALTLNTPEWLWLSTGIRAVDHAVETLASKRSNVFADGMARSALIQLSEGLRRSKADPQDLEARTLCQLGAWQAALPMVGGIPMGASHAIGHVLGGTCGVPHGITSCVMAPYVQHWNASCDDGRQKAISEALGDEHEATSVLLDRLIAGLGLPRRLCDVGVTRDKFPILAELTLKDIWGATNPRPLASEEDVITILELAA